MSYNKLMPTASRPRPKVSLHQKKRQGLHHNKGKQYVRHYWPYIPLLLVIFIGLAVSFMPQSHTGVLAYATNVSQQALLKDTNTERVKEGSRSLTINQQLTRAAQDKANDMAQRNYWSHNTPDGKEPWVFVDAAGYEYRKAGENLAYGFTSNSATITGWMNSPSHRSNLLDPLFSEVGFGFANVANYQDKGPVTVIVAMYGLPLTASVPAPAQNGSDLSVGERPITTQSPVVEPAVRTVSRVQALTGDSAPWLSYVIGFVSGLALTVMLLRHGLALRLLLLKGESFILHHPLVDAGLLAIVVAGVYLGQVTGFIT